MGGKAIKEVRSLNQDEIKRVYKWVCENIFPIIGITEENVCPIGSFGKKPEKELSGDIDIAISSEIFINEGMKFSEIASSINLILKETGYETKFLKGFEQISLKAPIQKFENNNLITEGYAQVDLIPVINLEWAKFMYHSPNLKENESKYKGAVRNALLMSIISESTKEVSKLFEGKEEEYNSLAIRFPTGVWDIKRSFMGKKGKIVKKGKILESEFITNKPQDVIDLAFGEGFKKETANSFETIWEVIHKKDFIHKKRLNEIMSKFKVNLKSMMQQIPEEAIKKYPKIFEEFLTYTGPSEDPLGIYKNPKRIDGFDKDVKAFLDSEGNMYIEDYQGDWLHKDMAEELRRKGIINYVGNFYENNFVPLIRLGRTNNLAYTEGSKKNMESLQIIKKAQKKMPQYKFFTKHYEDVKNLLK